MKISPYATQNTKKNSGTTNFAANVYAAKSRSHTADKKIQKLVGDWMRLDSRVQSGKDFVYPNITDSSVFLQNPPRKIKKRLSLLSHLQQIKLEVFRGESLSNIRGAFDAGYQQSLARLTTAKKS